tara:strand:+ start:42 stop:275 length:234 start_codon:yes stop_codon:yes gene_type:complete
MRDYSITKYKGNTHYTVNVTDSYGQEHVSFFRTRQECGEYVYKVWINEVKQEEDLLGNAIAECIQIDIDRGKEPILD